MPTSTPWRLPATAAFPVLAAVLFAFFFAASAPSPLFVVFQQAWGFSSAMLTVAFAVYALALLASLLVAGALSDHVGRRPVMLAALLLQAMAMVIFLMARGIGGLIVARLVQGIATGIATGALSAAVVEAAPASRKRLGATIISVSPLAGLATGALVTGIAARFAQHPVQLVFGVLALVCTTGGVLAMFVPETAVRRPGAWASLVPRVSIPHMARADFVRAMPVLVTVWALGGLFLALAPSVMLHLFKIDNGVVNGLAIAILCGCGAAAPSLLGRFAPQQTVAIGLTAIAVGALMLLASVGTRSPVWFMVATAVAGIGFGASFSASVQILAPLAQAHQRAELFAAIFVVSYLAFSVPAMAAGLLIAPLGLLATVQGYLASVLVLAGTGAWGRWSLLRRRG